MSFESPKQNPKSPYEKLGLNQDANPYEVLGIEQEDSLETAKKAYRKLAMEHHPDVGGDDDIFKLVSEAYTEFCETAKGSTGSRDEDFNPQTTGHFDGALEDTDDMEEILKKYQTRVEEKWNQILKKRKS
jgi:DnaJ-class molecular chaperone